MREKRKSKHKLSEAKVCNAEQVRKYFVNPETEKKVFSQYVNGIICSLDFKNTEAVVRRYKVSFWILLFFGFEVS